MNHPALVRMADRFGDLQHGGRRFVRRKLRQVLEHSREWHARTVLENEPHASGLPHEVEDGGDGVVGKSGKDLRLSGQGRRNRRVGRNGRLQRLDEHRSTERLLLRPKSDGEGARLEDRPRDVARPVGCGLAFGDDLARQVYSMSSERPVIASGCGMPRSCEQGRRHVADAAARNEARAGRRTGLS